ncbi:cuticle protein 19-like [Periplaneta americana]|uniref:cuticle protein 19-like n=1 Tax=Periplaneta americana TaxID=6978 RepID=UPI0037E840F6
MAFLKVAVVLATLVAISLAQHHHHEIAIPIEIPVEQHHHHEVEVEEHHHSHPKYEFKYGVKDEHTHDIKEQHEKRDGHKVTGYYKLVEPDHTTRIVHYTADKHSGFHAKVERVGHAVHPIHKHH